MLRNSSTAAVHVGTRRAQPFAFSPGNFIPLHPSLAPLFPRLQLLRDCWHLLACPREGDRRERHLARGEREPEIAYRWRLEAALASGFFHDALRSFAGILASSHWRELPTSLQTVISDVDGCGTDLGVFPEAAGHLVCQPWRSFR